MKDIKGMIVQNKTTTNLRIWLSVLSENRTKHAEYEVLVIGFLVSQYRKGLLDPLDGTPSLEKTVFRVCELLSRFFKVVTLPRCRIQALRFNWHAKRHGCSCTSRAWMASRQI